MTNSNNKTEIIIHNSKNIVFLNLCDASPDTVIGIAKQAIPLIRTEEKYSVLMLTDLSNLRFNREVTEYAKEYLKKNKPFIKKSAVLGVDGLKRIILQTAIKITGRVNLKLFTNKEEALNWLTK